jgi:DMSO/TMAO reductase YedYZ molybdopterin-dependent catalytic subunit
MEIGVEELQLAARNHGMPLEALRLPITPVGMHYLLTHYDIPLVDGDAWRLEVGGDVERPLSLSLADLRAREPVELVATMECAGNGRALLEPHVVSQPWLQEAVGTGRWNGVALASLLDEAGARGSDVVFSSLDRGVEAGVEQSFERGLPIDEARGALLAFELNGAPLPPQHGFPLRLVVPGWYGMTNVKWLGRIAVTNEPFAGHQQAHAYRLRQSEDELGEPLGRMLPRALMAPPGRPEFPPGFRHVDAGACVLEGRAWSGHAPVAAVEVSADGGATWAAAEVEPGPSPWAWSSWRYTWEAEPGEHELCCRARDEAGNEQPLAASWNLGGYANNAVQRVPVRVA